MVNAGKFMGRNNPNTKYTAVDDGLFRVIDSPEKAYLLGWIASDGSLTQNGTIVISLQTGDNAMLGWFAEVTHSGMPVRCKLRNISTWRLYSTSMCKDICSWLNILPGKKARIVTPPVFFNEELSWAFARGYFEGDGCVSQHKHAAGWYMPRCTLTSLSPYVLQFFAGLSTSKTIPYWLGKDIISWDSYHALDFLGELYASDAIPRLDRKYMRFLDLAQWKPALRGRRYADSLEFVGRWAKTLPNAYPPFKVRVSDSGYDLTLVQLDEQMGNLYWYTTGIKVQPPAGYYFDLVPRSSIVKTGYVLANSVGVIDMSYIGPIKVPLIKVNPNVGDLELPCRLVQLVPRPIIHVEFKQVDDFEVTSRNAAGFGSTGR